MTSEMIEKFVEKVSENTVVNIHFKDRSTVTGVFVHANDYNEMKSKNFWRIVSSRYADEWKQTKNMNLARLFNGASFTRLSEENVS